MFTEVMGIVVRVNTITCVVNYALLSTGREKFSLLLLKYYRTEESAEKQEEGYDISCLIRERELFDSCSHFIDMPRCLDGLKKICVEGVKNGNFLAVA
jgi:hypothetical protein